MQPILTPVAIALVFLASGCTTDIVKKSKEYGVMSEVIRTGSGTFRIYEHPSGTKIAVTRSPGEAVGQGLIQGATLGLVKGGPSQGAYHEAVEFYLKKHDALNHCTVLGGYILSNPTYEFRIDCSVSP